MQLGAANEERGIKAPTSCSGYLFLRMKFLIISSLLNCLPSLPFPLRAFGETLLSSTIDHCVFEFLL